jgi:hypothetical protein
MRFGWPPGLVDSLDPDFVEELAARINAGHERERDAAERARRERERQGRRGRYNGMPGRYVVASVPVD